MKEQNPDYRDESALDDKVKERRSELEAAIAEVLSDSPKIHSIIQEIRAGGYDALLIVEATIGLCRKDELLPGKPGKVQLELTRQDKNFLRELKIRPT